MPEESAFSNPYLKEAAEWTLTGERDSSGYMQKEQELMRRGLDAPDEPTYHDVRHELTAKYSWAVPTEDAIETIAEYSPIVELGAGLGYWAWLIEQKGGDVVAYDIDPSTNLNQSQTNQNESQDAAEPNRYGNTYEDYLRDTYTTVLPDDECAVLEHQNRTLFLCWPPYNSEFAERALKLYEGDHVIYVGEGRGGCTANDTFHRLLDTQFETVDLLTIPRYPGIHDSVFIYERSTIQ